MFPFFYQFLLHLYALAMLPRFIWQRKGRSLATWFGWRFARKKFDIWIHAVSVGEAKAVCRLVKELKAIRPNQTILVTSTTATGHAEVKRSLPGVDHAAYLPLDFSYIIRPIVRRVSPSLFLLSETDYWPTLLRSLKEGGSRIEVINGKVSAKSASRLLRVPSFAKMLYQSVDHFCLQDEVYAKRFEKLGISRSKMTVTGNLKYENPPIILKEKALKAFADSLKLEGPVITAGSTHEGEEALILSALQGIKILLVPRHPHRFDSVAELLKKRGIQYGRYSEKESLTGKEQVILIDAMGILPACYQLSSFAVIGGSFISGIGGHNILEPLWCSCPPIFGPYMENQPGMVELIEKYSAGLQVPVGELQGAVFRLLEEGKMGLVAAGEHLLKGVQGATERTLFTLYPPKE